MTRRVLFLCLLLWPCLAGAQDAMSQADFARNVQEKFAEVGRLWQGREFEKAIVILEELAARQELRTLGSAWPATLYNLACGYSLLNRGEQALSRLREAAEAGFTDVAQLERDTDLDNIRDTPAFRDVVRRLKARERFWENPALNTPYRDDLSAEEKAAGLSKLWSEVKYNFAFFDRVPDVDWDSLYVANLSRVRQTKSTLEYYRVLQEMTARLRDGHTGVNLPHELYDETTYRPAIRTRLIEDRVLIVEVGTGGKAIPDERIRPGLEITRIDGVPVREYAARRILPYVRASTPQARDVWAYDYDLLVGRKNENVELELRDDRGLTHTVRLSRTEPTMVRPPSDPEVRLLAGGIAHVALKSFGDPNLVAGLDSLFGDLEKTEALVLDLRDNGGGNSSVGYALLGHLTDHPFSIVPCTSRDYRPIRRALGFKDEWREEDPINWPVSASGCYRKPVVVLVGPRTGSAAEDFCVTFRALQRGPLIGELTAGSTGQPLVFGLPGGGNATVCTAHCTSPDGVEFVGVGIRPDVEVRPGMKDVVAGRDVVLEAAVDYLRRGGVSRGE